MRIRTVAKAEREVTVSRHMVSSEPLTDGSEWAVTECRMNAKSLEIGTSTVFAFTTANGFFVHVLGSSDENGCGSTENESECCPVNRTPPGSPTAELQPHGLVA